MNIRDAFVEYLRGLDEARVMLRVPSALFPFVVVGALEALVLFALAWFTVAPFSNLMVPVVERIGGDAALHYPMHFILLPGIYGAIYLPMIALVGFALYGRAVFTMGASHKRGNDRRPFVRHIPTLIIVGVVYVAVAATVPAGVAWLGAMAGRTLAGPVGLVGLLAGACAQVLLVYAPLCVWRDGSGPVGALRAGVREGVARFFPTLLIVLTVTLAHRPIEYMLSQPNNVVLKFKPELVFYLLAAGIVLEVLTSFLLFASTTGLALSRREDPFA